MYYHHVQTLSQSFGNNAIDFEQRKNLGSDAKIVIPVLKQQSYKDLSYNKASIAYEYVDENNNLIVSSGLETLIESTYHGKDLYIIDNHNHAFAMRRRSYLAGTTDRGSHLIHIDQHSDLQSAASLPDKDTHKHYQDIDLQTIDNYTNEVLTIANFIKPAHTIGLLSRYEMILTEYSLLHYDMTNHAPDQTIIVDIDLDFRAPEMSIANYAQTITQVRKILALSPVKAITIATSPTYIDPDRAQEVLEDILDTNIDL